MNLRKILYLIFYYICNPHFNFTEVYHRFLFFVKKYFNCDPVTELSSSLNASFVKIMNKLGEKSLPQSLLEDFTRDEIKSRNPETKESTKEKVYEVG